MLNQIRTPVLRVKRLSRLPGLLAVVVMLSGIALLGPGPARAQSGGLAGSAGLLRADGLGDGFEESAGDLTVHASILPPTVGHAAQLSIAVDIPKGWHTYSITQPANGPYRTQIKLDPSDEYRLDGEFSADPPPHVHMDDAFPGVPQEEHAGHVVWTAPLVFRQGVDLGRLKISGSVNAQRCSTGCLAPKDFKFIAALAGAPISAAGFSAPAVAVAPSERSSALSADAKNWSLGKFTGRGSDAAVQGWIEPSVVAPGGTARLVLSISPGPGAHVYALAPRDAGVVGSGKPTLIALQKMPHWTIEAPRPDRAPVEDTSDAGPQSIYDHPIRWTVNILIPPNAAGSYPIEGIIGYQTCTRLACMFPEAARFKGQIVVASGGLPPALDERPLSFHSAPFGEAAKWTEAVATGGSGAAATGGNVTPEPENSAHSAFFGKLRPRIKGTMPTGLATVILFGLVGGLILNLMPCVLPVIGLKILGFVEQGGQSRTRTLALNLWYSLGLLAVFMVLAALAVNVHLMWGQQFQSAAFVIVMCGVVFVMALSFLGVWEIPIPGFVGSGKSAKLAAKEGAAGAFAKGVLTTVLATPCSGPYLGAVFSYALTQSPLVTYVVFASIGLGMASPYLLIGAFPSLVRFLPKPGAWMETFKQLMGFVLLGTVVYLFSLLDKNLFVPVLALMIGLWAGCWWIGRTPLTADLARKLWAWGTGAAIAGAIGWFALTVLVPHPEQPHPAVLDWEPYTTARLDQLLSEGKTVMVDFTANWCPTCQFNLAHAINTQVVKHTVKANGVVALSADFSASSPENNQMLKDLGFRTIPVLAVFPADRPNEPIVLPDLISQSEIVETLKEAGPSRAGLAAIDTTTR